MVLSKFDTNEIKIIIALFHIKGVSYKLRLDKIWHLYDILRLNDEDLKELEEGYDIETLITDPAWITQVDILIDRRDFLTIKRMIVKELLKLESYETIIELRYEKIKP